MWKWPGPVLLKTAVDAGILDSNVQPFRVWDPRVVAGDQKHLMPIITPAYPHQNSAVNVSSSNLRVMQIRIRQASDLTGKIMAGEASWEELFTEPSDFFESYKQVFFYALCSFTIMGANLFFSCCRRFIVLKAISGSGHLIWTALVEAKIRHLVSELDSIEHIQLAHLHPKQFQLDS